jgi:hypothetical protein
MEYEDSEIEIQDLDFYAKETGFHAKPAIIAFVRQFHAINTRWGNWYEPVTEGIITVCAAMQEDILIGHRPGRELPTEIDLILSSALKILGLCRNIENVEGYLGFWSREKSNERNIFMTPEEVSMDKNPSITISRIESSSSTLAALDGTLLAGLIRELVSKTQRLLLRGRHQDLPILFCALCLLKLIQSSSTCNFHYINLPQLDGCFEFVNKCLCRLYDAVSEGQNPLVDAWNQDEYAELVDSCSLALNLFQTLNNLWVNAGK